MSSPNRMIGCLVTMCLFLAAISTAFADEALTARNKALVTDFYTSVLIGRNVDAAPRFLSPEYIQHSGNMPSGQGLHGSVSDQLREAAAERLQT